MDRDSSLACQLNRMGCEGLLGPGYILELERPDLFHAAAELATFSWLERFQNPVYEFIKSGRFDVM